MPMTFSPSQPHNKIGPGLTFQLQSTATGAGTIADWTIEIFQTVSPFTQVWTQHFVGTGGTLSARLGYSPGHGVQLAGDYDFFSDDAVTLYAFARDSSDTLIDSANFAATWEGQEGVGTLVALQPQTTGGLTGTQAVELTNAANYSQAAVSGLTSTIVSAAGSVQHTLGEMFSGRLLDLLTEDNLSHGTTCDPVDADISGLVLFGIRISIDSYPASWSFFTPDHAWSVADLAVLTIKRGGSEILRHGIHTLTHQVEPLPGIPLWPLTAFFPMIPGDYSVRVDWAPGVCGTVIALEFP